jgi:hypothetical protein
MQNMVLVVPINEMKPYNAVMIVLVANVLSCIHNAYSCDKICCIFV